ncbi:Mbov_0401 family ICE element transposase-like protein [Spiroplasma endosymbiont of Lasioglossum malachurum]|uniref:Mbov_0401 family ICE element transposase-like protein n=1 Tax=Spiroplasma endosymbiont of Lasioglossum malachurum TaxID=3066319 RepID=UPI0030D1C110
MFSFKRFLKSEITNILAKYFQKIHDFDEYFFLNRDKNQYKVAWTCNRTVNTPIGIDTFRQRVYWDTINKRHYYPIYEEFGIKKRARITNDLYFDILDNLIENLISKKGYFNIQSEFKYTSFSKNLISRIFKNAKIEKWIPEEKFKVLDNEKLNICADDAYITCWDENGLKQQYCCRLLTYNLGRKEIYSYRNKLDKKITSFMLFKTNNASKQEELHNFTMQTINNHYDIKLNIFAINWEYNNYNLVVSGDGALWIRAMASWLGCYYILDKYHAFSYLWKSFVNVRGKHQKKALDWTKYLDVTTTFSNGNYNGLITILENNHNKVTKKTYNYFKNNEQGIINQNADWNIGCSAKSDVYHFLKSLTNGAKIYNYQTLNNMLIAKANYLNYRSYLNST